MTQSTSDAIGGAPVVSTAGDIASEIQRRQRFVVTSHARPDGDAIGSALAMAYALTHLGKEVRVVFRDPPPPPLLAFPGVSDILVADHVDDPGDGVIVMECGDLARTGIPDGQVVDNLIVVAVEDDAAHAVSPFLAA